MDEGTLFNPETGELRAGDECKNCARATQERLQAERDLHAAELELRKVRRANKALTTELHNQQRKAQEYGVAEALGRYWILRCGKDTKRTVLGEKRLKKVMARLQDGYAPFYIARAIDGLAEFFWTNENTGERHNDLELVCRDETKIEKYHDLAEANKTATRVDRVWLKEFGVSDQFVDVREHLNDLAGVERERSETSVSGKDSDMAEYDDTNRGVLFKNDRKEKESQPDYRGEVNVNGDEFELAAWIRKSQKGVPYMSLSIKPKGEYERQQQGGASQGSQTQTTTAPAAQSATAPVADDEDDIPFLWEGPVEFTDAKSHSNR